jgi:quercetin dioxygenase-like cupin family protein
MRKIYRNVFWAGGLLFFSACVSAPTGVIHRPDSSLDSFQWTAEEKAQPLVFRLLGKTNEASYHVIRVGASEEPHTHNRHDIVVTVLRGAATLHLADRTFPVRPGEVIEIPRGVVHWAEMAEGAVCEIFAVITPPFDGKDRQPAGRER